MRAEASRHVRPATLTERKGVRGATFNVRFVKGIPARLPLGRLSHLVLGTIPYHRIRRSLKITAWRRYPYKSFNRSRDGVGITAQEIHHDAREGSLSHSRNRNRWT
jgi:hypothetical protein